MSRATKQSDRSENRSLAHSDNNSENTGQDGSVQESPQPLPMVSVRADEVPPVDEPKPGPQRSRQAGRRQRHRTRNAIVLAFLLVVGFTGAAVGYSLLQPTVYGAQAEFILTPRSEISDAAADRATVTQTMLIQSNSVLGSVAAQAGMSLDLLRKDVSVSIVGRSNVLRLTVGNRDQAQAVRLVQLISARYLAASSTVAPVATTSASGDRGPAITPSVLTIATPLEDPLQPRPLRALAAGLILGLLAGAVVVTLMMQPRFFSRPSPYWD